MSFQTFVTEKLTAITNMLNAILTNAKKIDELQPQNNLNPNSKIHVSLNGVSESVQIAQIIAASSSSTGDQLLSVGQIVVEGNLIKIPAGATWIIAGVNYGTTTLTEITVPYCASGLTRLDLLVANTLNQIVLVSGVETSGIVVPPNKPINTVLVSQILVTDSEVGNPEQPIVGALYVAKSESQNVMLTGSGVINILQITDERTSIVFAGSITRLNTIKYFYEMYNGKIVTLYNRQSINVTIPHASPNGSVDFNFPDGKDYVLKPGQVITFFFDMSYYPYSHHMFIGESGKEDISNKNQPNGYPGLDSSGKISSNQLPSYVDDVLEGYLLSNVFYSDVAHTIVIPAESGKVYVDITTGQKNKQYRYSGSTYIQITNGLIASTDDVPEGETNKYSTLALVMAYVLTGVSFATGTPITAADNILSAFGKLQKQITDLIASISGKQVLDTQIEIGANGNVQNSWHGQTILFTANCTITVPATLNNSLMFPFRTLTGVTVTWAITSPFVWETTPLATTEKTTGHFMRRGATNTILLDF